jgi:hypothetical protein
MTTLALVTLMPGRLGSQARLASVRRELGTDHALVAFRQIAGQHLAALGPPVGFGPRPGIRRRKRRGLQQVSRGGPVDHVRGGQAVHVFAADAVASMAVTDSRRSGRPS